MAYALGISGHLCQVLTHVRYSFSDNRPLTKYGVPGWQNTGGIMAVLLAEMGYMGDTTVFDPEYGFWKMCGYEGWQPENITAGLGKTWNFTKVNYKPYPCCRMLHSALDCFLSIINKNKLTPDDIENVQAFFHPCAELPLFTNRELTNCVDIQ